MDKIWDRNLSKSEVIGRCGGGEKPDRTDKSRTLKKNLQKNNAYLSNEIMKRH